MTNSSQLGRFSIGFQPCSQVVSEAADAERQLLEQVTAWGHLFR